MPIDLSRMTRESTSLITPKGKRRLAAVFLFFLAMLTAGNIPGAAQAASNEFGDKILHLVAYACVAGTIFLSFSRHQSAITLISVALLGSLDELIQSLFPYRSADLTDLLTDLAAAALAIAIVSLVKKVANAKARMDDSIPSEPRRLRAQEAASE